MAAPNIVNVSTITGKTAVQAVSTSATAIVTNSAASGKVYKVNALLVSNVDGTNSAEVTIDLYRSSTAYHLIKTASVSAGSTLDLLAKTIYLEEGDSIRLTGSAASDLEAVCSYEEIDATDSAVAGIFSTLTATGNTELGDAEATDTHAIKGATTLLANTSSDALRITQTGSGNALVVEDSTNPDATPFVVDANGKVGIGATPSHALHIKSNTPGVYLEESDGTSTHNASFIVQNADNLTIQTRDSSGTFVATDYQIQKGASGATNHDWRINNSTKMSIDSSGLEVACDVIIDTVDFVKLKVLDTTNSRVPFALSSGTNAVTIENDTAAAQNHEYIAFDQNASALLFGTNGSTRMRIDSSGNALVGTTLSTPGASNTTTGHSFRQDGFAFHSTDETWALSLNRNNTDGQIVRINRSGTQVGSISVTTTATAYNTSSDYRLKENVTDLDGAIDRLKQIPVHRFNFIADPDTTVDGFLAHEAQAVVPECVTGTKDEVDDEGNPVYQGIDQSKLVPLLTAALQETLAKIESQQSQIDALTARIEALEA